MNPAPGLLSDWITIPAFLWLVLGCIAVVWLAIFTIQIVRVWDENDAANQDAQDDHVQQQVNRYHCAAHGCTWVLAENDAVYVCAFCLARVVRDADLYDQENGVA